MSSGVYVITCVPTGQRYIGASTNIQARWSMHRSVLRRGSGNKRFQAAWNTYGEAAFTFAILELVADIGLLAEREQVYLDQDGMQGLNELARSQAIRIPARTSQQTAGVFYLSKEAFEMIGKLGRELYRGRPRVASQTIERLIREECERRGIKSE